VTVAARGGWGSGSRVEDSQVGVREGLVATGCEKCVANVAEVEPETKARKRKLDKGSEMEIRPRLGNRHGWYRLDISVCLGH
jgi:hypothetical protein